MINYKSIKSLKFEASCASINKEEWDKLMEGAKRGNKREINALVKKLLPDLWWGLELRFNNPYNYYKTNTHLILVHSATEYFLKIN